MATQPISFPLREEALEAVPRNIRRTQVVKLSRTLAKEQQSELIQQLCKSRYSSSSANSESSSTATKEKKDDLKAVLGEETINEGDPTLSYHFQEIGLLVAASSSEKAPLLKLAQSKQNQLIAKKALALAIHSPCVLDEDIKNLFNSSNEREKHKILRACARDAIRENLTNDLVYSWLKENDARRVTACEVLHSIKQGTDWFGDKLRDIIQRGREAQVSESGSVDAKKKYHIDSLCYKALRYDLLWKRHADAIFGFIAEDVQRSELVLDKAAAFDFWLASLQVDSWILPADQTKSSTRRASLALSIPWSKLLQLYAKHRPFEPSASSHRDAWTKKRFNGEVSDKTTLETLSGMLTLKEVNVDWESHFQVVNPPWLSSRHFQRSVSADEVFSAVRSNFMSANGSFPKRYAAVSKALLLAALQASEGSKTVTPTVLASFSAMLKKILEQIPSGMFYYPERSEEFFETAADYKNYLAVNETKTFLLSLASRFLLHRKLTTGQQLEIFMILHGYSKTLLLKSNDFNSPLQMVGPNQIKALLIKYEDFLVPYTDAVATSLSIKIRHALERNKSTEMMDKVFERVVALGITEVQQDIEKMYVDLSTRFPAVFGFAPSQKTTSAIMPRVLRFSRNRPLGVSKDIAARLVDELFVKSVIPAVRDATFGEDALFSDRPGRLAAQYRPHSKDITIRAHCLETMESARQTWFDYIMKISPALQNQVLSSNSTSALFGFLSDWITVSTQACQSALEAKRENKFSQQGLAKHPETAPLAHESLRRIATFLSNFIRQRVEYYLANEWKDDSQADLVKVIRDAFRLWSSASFYTDNNDPLNNFPQPPSRLDPYVLDSFLRTCYALPDAIREPFTGILHSLFALRLNGKIQLSTGNVVAAPVTNYRKHDKAKDYQPWNDASELFTAIFSAFGKSQIKGSHELLAYLEKLDTNERASNNFLKALEQYMDVRLPHYRKRLEQDLTRPLFADRFACMSTLLAATKRTMSTQEFVRTMQRLAKAIENETHDNRMKALEMALPGYFGTDIVSLAMPSAEAAGNHADRLFVQFLHSAPKDEEWPDILEAADALPKILYKLLDDLIDSPDEKTDANFKVFRTLSDEIFRRCLTWRCSVLDANADLRISKVQSLWFDCAMEIQWRITCFKSGRTLASNTFRPMLSTTTQTKTRNFILEAGFQFDRPFPKGKAETREWEAEANVRRQRKARYVAGLFADAYRSRIGPVPSLGAPLSRKPALEKKRMLDILNLVQGHWVDLSNVVERFEDVVQQVGNSETTRSHQNQVLELAKAFTEASISWGVKCRDSRPDWADKIPKVELIIREKKRGVEMQAPKKKRGKSFGKHGKGGSNTALVPADEDAPWSAAKYFSFIHPSIFTYWRICIEKFGIHHPAGPSTGRCLLRMYLRRMFSQADESATRAARQTLRCQTALNLLEFCPSAVHLRVVQAVLKDFRQDLLETHIFGKEPVDPILGKFSPLSPNEDDDDQHNDDDDDDDVEDEDRHIHPFRLGGFYGYDALTPEQGRRMAARLIADIQDPGLATVERLRASSKLTFLPAVGHQDFANLLSAHFSNKALYLEAMRKKKSEGTEITATLPLPDSVVETLFRAVLSDSNPMALMSLLSTSMMRESSTKTTILVAQRAVLLLDPLTVIELIRILFARKNRDGLLVGPVKTFLRILFSFASQKEAVVGATAIEKAVEVLESQWARNDLHPDARVVLVSNAQKNISQPSSPKNEYFAWKVLSDVAQNATFPNALRALLWAAQPSSSSFNDHIDLALQGEVSKNFKDIIKEAVRFGVPLVHNQSRYMRLLLEARDTCQRIYEAAMTDFRANATDRRKQGVFNKIANSSLDVRALLLSNIIRWVDSSEETYQLAFSALQQDIATLSNEKRNEDNMSRLYISSTVVPTTLASLASASHALATGTAASRIFKDVSVEERIGMVLTPLVNGLHSEVPLTEPYKRAAYATCVTSLVNGLSKEGRKGSLYRNSFADRFKASLADLRRESELSAKFSEFTPQMQRDDDE